MNIYVCVICVGSYWGPVCVSNGKSFCIILLCLVSWSCWVPTACIIIIMSWGTYIMRVDISFLGRKIKIKFTQVHSKWHIISKVRNYMLCIVIMSSICCIVIMSSFWGDCPLYLNISRTVWVQTMILTAQTGTNDTVHFSKKNFKIRPKLSLIIIVMFI